MKTTCDFHEDFGNAIEILPYGLKSYGARQTFHGPIETVKCYEDNSRLRELSRSDGDGRVLVIDGGGSLHAALVGARLGRRFAENGWAGLVIWGAVKDVTEIRKFDIGILALGHIPRHCMSRGEGQVDVRVRLGDARVEPYGYLFSDENGTVIFPPDIDHPTFE